VGIEEATNTKQELNSVWQKEGHVTLVENRTILQVFVSLRRMCKQFQEKMNPYRITMVIINGTDYCTDMVNNIAF
jgi:hypothetical protein